MPPFVRPVTKSPVTLPTLIEETRPEVESSTPVTNVLTEASAVTTPGTVKSGSLLPSEVV